MTTVRIYQPPQTAMQSGKGKTKYWLVEYETKDPLLTESLMGWVTSHDTRRQLRLFFPTLGEAIQFAKLKGLSYTICNPTRISIAPKSYGINFTCPRIRGV